MKYHSYTPTSNTIAYLCILLNTASYHTLLARRAQICRARCCVVIPAAHRLLFLVDWFWSASTAARLIGKFDFMFAVARECCRGRLEFLLLLVGKLMLGYRVRGRIGEMRTFFFGSFWLSGGRSNLRRRHYNISVGGGMGWFGFWIRYFCGGFNRFDNVFIGSMLDFNFWCRRDFYRVEFPVVDFKESVKSGRATVIGR